MAARPAVHEPTIASAVVRSLSHALAPHHGTVARGLAVFDLEACVSAQPPLRVSLNRYLAWFEWLAQELRNPMLGLDAAQRSGAEHLGAVGFLFLSSPTLGAALRILVRYTEAIQDASQHEFRLDGQHAVLVYRLLTRGAQQRRQDTEYSIALLWRLIQRFSSHGCGLARVEFEHGCRGAEEPTYRRAFGAPVLFDQPANALYLRREAIDLPSRSLDPHLFPILEAQVQETLRSMGSQRTTSDQVRGRLLANHLGDDLGSIARQLGISRATLQRRLQREGTSFRAITQSLAQDMARQWLESPATPIGSMAQRLGYSETACFTRAFGRWFGVSPRDYRRGLPLKPGDQADVIAPSTMSNALNR